MKSWIIKTIGIAVMAILIVSAGSGWIYSYVKSTQNTKSLELSQLNASFAQQYGSDGIIVKQLVQSNKVYSAVWSGKDGMAHVSWNVGGLWVTVYSYQPPATPTPTSTPTP